MKKQFIWIGVIIFVLFVGGCMVLNRQEKSRYAIQFEDRASEVENMEAGVSVSEEVNDVEEGALKIYVDVKGAVKQPGVYEVESHLRVIDVIFLAGGFLENANQNMINLSEKIVDEMVIFVPSLDDEGNPSVIITQQQKNNDKININKANASELQTLPGIGKVKAEAIVAYREEVGRFETIEALMQVSGIGEKTFEAIKELVDY